MSHQVKFRTPPPGSAPFHPVGDTSIHIHGLQTDTEYTYHRISEARSLMVDNIGSEYTYTPGDGWEMSKYPLKPYTQQELFNANKAS